MDIHFGMLGQIKNHWGRRVDLLFYTKKPRFKKKNLKSRQDEEAEHPRQTE